MDKEIKNNIIYVNTLEIKPEKELKVLFQLAPFVTFKLKICELSNGWDMPLQEEISLEKMWIYMRRGCGGLYAERGSASELRQIRCNIPVHKNRTRKCAVHLLVK